MSDRIKEPPSVSDLALASREELLAEIGRLRRENRYALPRAAYEELEGMHGSVAAMEDECERLRDELDAARAPVPSSGDQETRR